MRLVKLLLFVFTFQMPLFALTATNCYSTIGNNQLDTIDCSTGLVDNIVTVKPKYKGNTSNLKILSSNVLGYYDVAVPADISLKDYIQCLKATGMYESVEPCIMGKVHDISQSFTEKYSQSNSLSLDASYAQLAETGSFPNDTYYNLQSLDSYINLGDTWSITMGNPNVKMAIIDTGVDCGHPDLGEGSDGYSNIAESLGINADSVQYYHGTAVTGIIGAKTNNGIGIAGIAGGNNNNGITIIPYNVADGSSGQVINYNLVGNAILDAVDKGVKLINISLSFNSVLYSMPSCLSDAIDYAYNHNVTVICESGDSLNDNMCPVRHPGTHDKVITIGATVWGDRAPFSCGGSELDFVLPGYMIWSTGLNYSYSHNYAGTSYSTAMASGIVALMLSVNPTLTPSQVKAILKDTAIKIPSYTYNNGRCDEVGYGLLDAYAAVDMAQYYISGNDTLCQSDVYSVMALPSGATVTWTLSGSEASKFNLVQNSPSTNKCTITKKANAVFNSSSFNLTLTAKIYQGGTLIKTKTKTLTCNNGFACSYRQDAHEYYGVNYPAITQTQMTSATNYVYPGGIVYLQSEYFRGKLITTSGIFDNFQHAGQNIVRFSLPPFSSNPVYINVAADGCDDAVQLTFYPMTYYAMSGYSAQMSAIGSQEYRVSLVSNERSSSGEEIPFSEDVATVMNADNPVSWTVEAINAMTGRKMFSTEPKGTDYVLNTSNWESGLYVVRVIVAGEPIFAGKVTK